MRFLFEIAQGLQTLHSINLVHRDLKLSNILLDSNDCVKLTDFGLTKYESQIKGSFVGTPIYMAPEIDEGKCTR